MTREKKKKDESELIAQLFITHPLCHRHTPTFRNKSQSKHGASQLIFMVRLTSLLE